MKVVFIMRGVSGSGKSTEAEKLLELAHSKGKRGVIVSADHFFLSLDSDGVKMYRFDSSQIGQAHAKCMVRFLEEMMDGTPVIVVDNTNTRLWEFEAYQTAAKLAGYEVRIVEKRAETIEDVKRFAARNLHGTPELVVAQMAMQYEDLRS